MDTESNSSKQRDKSIKDNLNKVQEMGEAYTNTRSLNIMANGKMEEDMARAC